MIRSKEPELKERCRRQSIRNEEGHKSAKTLEDDILHIKRQLSYNPKPHSPRNESCQTISQNRYLLKKLQKKDSQLLTLKQTLSTLQKKLDLIQHQRNSLVRQKLSMGIQLSRLTQQNILLHSKSKQLKQKDCIICGLETEISLLKKAQISQSKDPRMTREMDDIVNEFRHLEYQRKLKHIENGTISSPKVKNVDELEKYKKKYRHVMEENNGIKFRIAEVECRNEELVRVDKERQEALGQKITQLETHMKEIISQNRFLKKKLKERIERG